MNTKDKAHTEEQHKRALLLELHIFLADATRYHNWLQHLSANSQPLWAHLNSVISNLITVNEANIDQVSMLIVKKGECPLTTKMSGGLEYQATVTIPLLSEQSLIDQILELHNELLEQLAITAMTALRLKDFNTVVTIKQLLLSIENASWSLSPWAKHRTTTTHKTLVQSA